MDFATELPFCSEVHAEPSPWATSRSRFAPHCGLTFTSPSPAARWSPWLYVTPESAPELLVKVVRLWLIYPHPDFGKPRPLHHHIRENGREQTADVCRAPNANGACSIVRRD